MMIIFTIFSVSFTRFQLFFKILLDIRYKIILRTIIIIIIGYRIQFNPNYRL